MRPSSKNDDSMASVYNFMLAEHEDERILLEQFKNTGTKPAFDKFVEGISRHMAFEEDVLFGVVLRHTGEKDNMLLDEIALQHSRIKSLIKDVYANIQEQTNPSDTVKGKVSELEELLRSHDSMEESDFYPWIDEFAAKEEINDAFEKLKQIKPNL